MENTPVIDYLSKDYASFRRMMLDHLTQRVPTWQEPSEADLGNVLVEVLAYAADYLSYYQDAVATEAYLETARLRTSVKRHTRLLDYTLHEGCNARVWVQVQVNQPMTLPQETPILTDVSNFITPTIIAPGSSYYADMLAQAIVFETLHDMPLFPAHNRIELYVEEGQESSLAVGSTSAVLLDPRDDPQRRLQLRVGDVLVFEEVKNSVTGTAMGADPTHRHAVRISALARSTRANQHLLTIHWQEADALSFTLPLSVYQHDTLITGISIASGNIVLADHGRSIRHEQLPVVPAGQRYRPTLRSTNLTVAATYQHAQAITQPANQALQQDEQAALPVCALFESSTATPLAIPANIIADLSAPTLDEQAKKTLRQQLHQHGIVLSANFTVRPVAQVGWELHDLLRRQYWLIGQHDSTIAATTYKKWNLRRDLLSSDAFDYDYVVDIEEDRMATLRFGNNIQGRQPQTSSHLSVTYRIGGGTQGNVRADTIMHIVSTDPRISKVRNPLAAQGGSQPQNLEDARFNAPYAFQAQERCVTAEDYARIAERHPEVLHAIAQLRWIGSWPTMFVYVQRRAGKPVDDRFLSELTAFMHPYRLTGHQLALHGPYFAPLTLALKVHLTRHAARNTVYRTLLHAFSSTADDFFFPDNFTFGQPFYASQLINRAMQIAGVARAEVIHFSRYHPDDTIQTKEETIGHIELQPLEIIQVANDATAPQHGTMRFILEGGA